MIKLIYHWIEYKYYSFMLWLVMRKVRRLRAHKLSSLDKYSDAAIIEGFRRLYNEQKETSAKV